MRRGSSRLAVLAAPAAVPLGAVLAATAALAGDDPVAAVQPVVVALPDWRAPGGREELMTLPTLRQRELAATAPGAGAEVVLGAHPHVLQLVELVA